MRKSNITSSSDSSQAGLALESSQSLHQFITTSNLILSFNNLSFFAWRVPGSGWVLLLPLERFASGILDLDKSEGLPLLLGPA